MVAKDIDSGKEHEHSESLTIASSFACQSCGNGHEYYDEMVEKGACAHCGASLAKVEGSISETWEEDLARSVLVIAAHDMSAKSIEISKELTAKGIRVVNSQNILNGTKISYDAFDLTFLITHSAYALILMSPELEQDEVITTSIRKVRRIDQEREDPIRLVPVMTSAESFRPSINLIDTIIEYWNGCNWDGIPVSYPARQANMSRDTLIEDIMDHTIRSSE